MEKKESKAQERKEHLARKISGKALEKAKGGGTYRKGHIEASHKTHTEVEKEVKKRGGWAKYNPDKPFPH